MPIYEYRCKECEHYLTVLQKISDDPLKECPECGKPEGLKRLISAPSFRLKGGGWYETDFKSDKERRRNLAGDHGSSGAEGASKSSESSSSDSSGSSSKSSESASGGSGNSSGSGSSSKSGGSGSSSGEGSKSASGGSQSKAAV